MTTVKQASRRVCRAAKLMDRQSPNWHRRIDLERLDLSSYKFCILGQVYGDFDDTRKRARH